MSATETTQPFADAAHELLEAGWSPLPLPPRAKANPPTGYTGEHGARPDLDAVDRWVSSHAAGNVAIRVPDGVVGVDVDQYGDKHGHDELEQLLAELDAELPATWISTARPAPSGIRWLRIPTGVRLRGAPLSGVEIVQPHHRYAVAPPSIHPDTGDRYDWIAPGGELSDAPPAPDELPAMPAELVDAWRDTAEPAPRRPAQPPAPAPANRDRSRAVDEVLAGRSSWTPGGRHDEACRLSMALARLEHSGHPGATEALDLIGADFTAAVGGERDGDREWRSIVDSARQKAATTEAQRPDYAELIRDRRPSSSSSRSDGDDLSGLDLEGQADELDLDDDEPPAWGEVEPLVRANVAEFPLDTLPDWIIDEAHTVADELAVPVDMPAVAAVGALATVAGGRLDVQAGPRFRSPTNLYVCIVAESGTGKSPAMDRMVTTPARELERRLVELNKRDVAASRAHTKRLEAARDKVEKQLRGNPTDELERDLIRAEQALEDDEPTYSPVVVLGDVTPERLTGVLAEQQGRAAIVTPEGGSLFESIAGLRYRSGGVDASAKVPDVYLSGYSREPLRTDRVGRTAVVVEKPTLTVVASVQPVVVERLAATPNVARQGALARFLWAWPTDLIGYRPSDSYRHAPADSGAYRDRLVELGLRARSWTTPLVIDVDDDACDELDAWAGNLERQLRPGGELRPHRAAVSKLKTTPWRIAGLLAFADDGAAGRRIDLELMRRALRLCDYFLANAIAAEQFAGVSADTSSNVQAVASKLVHCAGGEVPARELYKQLRSTLDTITELAGPLVELERMGWVRIDGDLEALGRQGARNPTVHVNPSLTAAALQPQLSPTRVPRVLQDELTTSSTSTTREPRELVARDNKNARIEQSRVRAFRETSSSLDGTRGEAPRATDQTARSTAPLFTPTPHAADVDLDEQLGADPFGPANTDTDLEPLW